MTSGATTSAVSARRTLETVRAMFAEPFSLSDDAFTLKVALLFPHWTDEVHRDTRDMVPSPRTP